MPMRWFMLGHAPTKHRGNHVVVINATTSLTLRIVHQNLIRSFKGVTFVLAIVIGTNFVIATFGQSFMRRDAKPWLEERPHAGWFESGTCEAEIKKFDKAFRAAEAEIGIFCTRIYPTVIARFGLGVPMITETVALEHSPNITAVFPRLASNFAEMRARGMAPCLDTLSGDPLLGASGLHELTVIGCDYTDVPHQMVSIGKTVFGRQSVVPGSMSLMMSDLSIDTLPGVLESQGRPPGDGINRLVATGEFSTGFPLLDRWVIVPQGAAKEARVTENEVRTMIFVRIIGARDLASVRSILETVVDHNPSFDTPDVSIFDERIWTEIETVTQLLSVFQWIVRVLIAFVVVFAINLLIERERKMFALARLLGFTTTRLFVTVCGLIFLVLITSLTFGCLAGWATGAVLVGVFPQLVFEPTIHYLLELIATVMALSLGTALCVNVMQFNNDIAEELLNVQSNS